MSSITLQSNIRSNLTALQGTADLLASTQNRLATGKKVNSALDNATTFFQASGMNDRASSLSGLLDGMSNGVQTIKAATKGADSIYTSIQSLKGLVTQASSAAASASTQATGTAGTLTATSAFAGASGDKLSIKNTTDNSTTDIDVSGATTMQGVIDAVNSGSSGNYTASLVNGSLSISAGNGNAGDSFSASVTNAGTLSAAKTTSLFNQGTAVSATTTGGPTQAQLTGYAKQMNDLLDSIGKTAQDSGFNGTNLLAAGSTMTTRYNVEGSSTSTVDGQDMSLSGLGLAKFGTPGNVTLAQITGMADKLDTASNSVRSFQGSLNTGLSVIQNRQDFSKAMININQEGAANLVNADMNEEGARLLSLQTSQSLSQSALSLANQANQGILQLLR